MQNRNHRELKNMREKPIDFDAYDLLRNIETHIKNDLEKNSSSFCVKTGGKVIRMWYSGKEEAEKAKEGWIKFIVPDQDDVSATFRYWEADFSLYLTDELIRCGTKLYYDGNVRLQVGSRFFISLADYRNKAYYYCTHVNQHFIGAHGMVNPYYLWGMENGMLMTHSACVGAEGKGVILVADGGGGKSTLAVASLMRGMDFISDDYTMVRTEKRCTGLPVYSNIGLTPQSYDMLKPPYPVHWVHKENRNKKFMDISAAENFKSQLPIKAMLTPCITEGPVRIERIETKPLLAKFYQSSMKQVLALGNQEYLIRFFKAFEALPAYRIELGRQVFENAEFLRNFIIKEL